VNRKPIVVGFLIALAALLAAGNALAGDTHLKAKTKAYNPAKFSVSDASQWVKGAGEPGGRDKQQQGLLLEMSRTIVFPPGASADATIEPAHEIGSIDGAGGASPTTGLGFDRLLGTYCTNGSPRWDVELENGGVYGVGCASGTHTPLSGDQLGWERIVFRNCDVQNLSGPAWPGGSACTPINSGGVRVAFLQVLQDEGPSATILDNLVVNGVLVDDKQGSDD
jgi:hypothetical protein